MTATLTSPPRRSATRHLRPHQSRLSPGSPRALPPAPSGFPTLVGRNGPVVALHQRDVIAVGSLAARAIVAGERMVAAVDTAGELCWLPAESVWVDADRTGRPDHPRPTGLATASDRASAMTSGLSDRLGWEAVLEFERGTDLPLVTQLQNLPERLVVLDGRLGHDVPTVVTLGVDIVRWGAGSTWELALSRAMFGHDTASSDGAELEVLTSKLRLGGLGIAAVDLGTPLLERAGIFRTSVQLMVATPWDGGGTRIL